ncbi:MAG: substrate-binding domain-containing protein [Betaproteobacteria bacterium]
MKVEGLMSLWVVRNILAGGFCLLYCLMGQAQAVTPADQTLAQAKEHGVAWSGPQTGPAAKSGATVAVICDDLRNGSVLGVAKGVSEAAKVAGWNIRLFDAGGTLEGREKAVAAAAATKPDGLVIVGIDSRLVRAPLLPLAARRMPRVGWHVGPRAGTMHSDPIAINVSADPRAVAKITALAASADSREALGFVIFTDSNFEIATTKANAMAAIIRACKQCTLLEVRDMALSKAAESMPAVVKDLLSRYGSRWTHALAINDLYFDYAAPALMKAARPAKSMTLLSAGDGSPAAFLRIRAGAFQTATVAEPLNLQGWQLVDELNRLLSGKPVTGYVIPIHLVTEDNIDFDGGPLLMYDPDNGYRDVYRRIWQR